MSRFLGNPDYELRWPPELFQIELRKLLDVADAEGVSADWRAQVEQLLRQAFSSTVPVDDFERCHEAPAPFLDEEPF